VSETPERLYALQADHHRRQGDHQEGHRSKLPRLARGSQEVVSKVDQLEVQNSLVQQAEDQAAWTWPAEEAHTRDQDCGWIGPRLSTVAGRQRWSWHIRHPSVLAKNGVRRDAGVEHKVQRTAIMNFVLHYRGPLKANGNPEHKHDLRRILSSAEIARLWQQPPLDSCRKWLTPPEAERTYSLRQRMAPFVFAPLVTEQMGLYAELQLELLRPEPPGRLLTQAGTWTIV